MFGVVEFHDLGRDVRFEGIVGERERGQGEGCEPRRGEVAGRWGQGEVGPETAEVDHFGWFAGLVCMKGCDRSGWLGIGKRKGKNNSSSSMVEVMIWLNLPRGRVVGGRTMSSHCVPGARLSAVWLQPRPLKIVVSRGLQWGNPGRTKKPTFVPGQKPGPLGQDPNAGVDSMYLHTFWLLILVR